MVSRDHPKKVGSKIKFQSPSRNRLILLIYFYFFLTYSCFSTSFPFSFWVFCIFILVLVFPTFQLDFSWLKWHIEWLVLWTHYSIFRWWWFWVCIWQLWSHFNRVFSSHQWSICILGYVVLWLHFRTKRQTIVSGISLCLSDPDLLCHFEQQLLGKNQKCHRSHHQSDSDHLSDHWNS